VARLFVPRKDNRDDHFAWAGPRLLGKTAVVRVTIDVFKMNLHYRLVIRAALIAEANSCRRFDLPIPLALFLRLSFPVDTLLREEQGIVSHRLTLIRSYSLC